MQAFPGGRSHFVRTAPMDPIDGHVCGPVRRERDRDQIIGYDGVNQLFWYPARHRTHSYYRQALVAATNLAKPEPPRSPISPRRPRHFFGGWTVHPPKNEAVNGSDILDVLSDTIEVTGTRDTRQLKYSGGTRPIYRASSPAKKRLRRAKAHSPRQNVTNEFIVMLSGGRLSTRYTVNAKLPTTRIWRARSSVKHAPTIIPPGARWILDGRRRVHGAWRMVVRTTMALFGLRWRRERHQEADVAASRRGRRGMVTDAARSKDDSE
ncbi:hypothetical protein JB92DRAFT_2833413 [Gautieria morchelliformis]|nr:hypothetical protein JB92DRAFT_2833413 [Gautieria morchelliformis]